MGSVITYEHAYYIVIQGTIPSSSSSKWIHDFVCWGWYGYIPRVGRFIPFSCSLTSFILSFTVVCTDYILFSLS